MNGNVLLDSVCWIEFFSGGSQTAAYVDIVKNATPETVVAPSIVLYEVYKKLKTTKGEEEAIRAVAYIVQHTAVIPLTEEFALLAADCSLRTKLAMADAIVFSVAQEYGALIVTRDRHFRGLPNVKLIE